MMKKLYVTALMLIMLFPLCVKAQHTFYYQSVVRDGDQKPVSGKEIKVRFTICKEDGNSVYSETVRVKTNTEGYFHTYIGGGEAETGNFSQIDWTEGTFSVKTEIDKIDTGEGFIYSGTQLLSAVPYATNTETASGIQKKTADGTIWKLTVDDNGNLSPIPIPKGYSQLVFHDEFNGTGLPDAGKWGYEEGFVRNGEKQYYTVAREENCYQKDGYLHIVCDNKETEIKNALVNKQWEEWTPRRKDTTLTVTSASITSKNSWKYCKVEVRAKLPMCLGTWPAIWMLPKGSDHGRGWWPDTGEMDIMEHVGYEPEKVHYTLHCNMYNSGTDSNPYNRSVPCPTSYTEFHVYGFEWSEDRIAWYLDGKLRFYVNRRPDSTWHNWPFDHPFYLILNQAFGGGWGGKKGIDIEALPQDYMIDYVRVYQ